MEDAPHERLEERTHFCLVEGARIVGEGTISEAFDLVVAA